MTATTPKAAAAAKTAPATDPVEKPPAQTVAPATSTPAERQADQPSLYETNMAAAKIARDRSA